MRQNLLVFAVMVGALLFFGNQSWAVCPQSQNDLGICDTFYIETFDGDNSYQATEGYDSVRVVIYVTHDSNTIPSGPYQGVQDSIASFVIPLDFDVVGCADSVVYPGAAPWSSGWNNLNMDETNVRFPRSIFRHLPPDSNRFVLQVNAGWTPWTAQVDVARHNPGHIFINMTPMSGTCQRWPEGDRTLLATLTFLVYMGEDCDSTAICFDISSAPPVDGLFFIRYDAAGYSPRYFLPVCDTIYYFISGDCNGNGIVEVADVVYLLNYLFVGGPAPVPCLEAGDATCDGIVDASDIVYLLNYLFVHGPSPGC